MHDNSNCLYNLSILEASKLIESRDISPVELTEAFLDRIRDQNSSLNAYITVTQEMALRQARKAEQEIQSGFYKGHLHGIPIALKDLFDTEGIKTTSGSMLYKERIPVKDSTVTARLNESGAVLLGKLAMSENAIAGTGIGFENPKNPWDISRTAGGSSNGSAVAVAAGMAMGAMGSCTRGSIRAPASFCNVVGLKPTYGRVSRHGVLPLSWTLDHVGPMTYRVEDAAIMLDAISGYDKNDRTSSQHSLKRFEIPSKHRLDGIKIAVAKHYFFDKTRPDVDPQVIKIAEEALVKLEQLGAIIEEINIPALEYADAAALVILLGEGYAVHQSDILTKPELYGELNLLELRVGGLFSNTEYISAQRIRTILIQQYAEAFKSYDFFASPTFAMVAPSNLVPTASAISQMPSFTGPYNLTGLPAISVPAGFTDEGLPVGLQLAANAFKEHDLLQLAYIYERETCFYKSRPTL